MSSYPPPPPPQHPPPYDRRAWARAAKDQSRAMRRQAKFQRAQFRMQARAMRRRSIVGPLVILTLGVIFLLVQIGKLSWAHTLDWYGRWWPAVLIVAGLILLAEWGFDQHAATTGSPRLGRTIGGGIVFLLVLLAIAGSTSHLVARAFAWKDNNFGMGANAWDFAFGDQRDWDDTVDSAIPPGGAFIVHNPHGDVTITGSAPDGQVHVSIHKHAYVMGDHDAAHKQQLLQPFFTTQGANLALNVADVRSGRDDLTIQLPRGTPLTITADDGDINVQQIHAAITLSANHGEVDLSAIDGPITAHVNNSDSSFSAHSVTGSIDLDGHAGDVTLSDITGPVTMQGEFYGTTDMERINGTVAFKTYRTQFTAARLDGEFEVSTGSDLTASQVLGPVVLKTSNRDITFDRVQGSVSITNTNGPVAVLDAAPLGPLNITNHDGSVDIGLPATSSFSINAQINDGNIQNDFGLQPHSSDDQRQLIGTVGSGGPAITVVTHEGDLTLHKSIVDPLPPAPPAPPRITAAPAAPTAPPAPKHHHHLQAPKVPATPSLPATPAAASGTF